MENAHKGGHAANGGFSPALTIGALGIVFGDIGTSPLYALKACFDWSHASPQAPADVIGIASLLVYTLVLVVCVKYLGVIMHADHEGEGGILALLALGSGKLRRGYPVAGGALFVIIVVGAAMLLGDGAITPAISVLSAIEGMKLLSDQAAPFIVPISIGILVGLFSLQAGGTQKIGRIFGPVMTLWFVTIGVAGIIGITKYPGVLFAFDPRHALTFLTHHGPHGFFVLGGVVLAVTGVEALYADMSHFGRKPIAFAWYGVVFPALIACYLGESAMTLVDPQSVQQPLYALMPGHIRIPAIMLATAATVIASQALISGAFTLVQQAIALGISPRLEVRHTSNELRGQVFVPVVNWLLMTGCVLLVLIFESSDKLASAFGLAVSCTMFATSVAWYYVARKILHVPALFANSALTVFLIIDGAFTIAGLPKFLDGGWVPFVVSSALTAVALTWRYGREKIAAALERTHVPIDEVAGALSDEVDADATTMVLLTSDAKRVPFFANHGWVRSVMNSEHVVLLTLIPEPAPRVVESERVRISKLGRITRIEARFGYMEPPRLAPIVDACRRDGIIIDGDMVSFLIAEPRIRRRDDLHSPFARIRRALFLGLSRSGRPISEDMQIPAERQIEVGITVAI